MPLSFPPADRRARRRRGEDSGARGRWGGEERPPGRHRRRRRRRKGGGERRGDGVGRGTPPLGKREWCGEEREEREEMGGSLRGAGEHEIWHVGPVGESRVDSDCPDRLQGGAGKRGGGGEREGGKEGREGEEVMGMYEQILVSMRATSNVARQCASHACGRKCVLRITYL